MRRSPRSPRCLRTTATRLLAGVGAVLLGSSLPARAATVPGSELPEPEDWAALGQDTAALLSAYLQVDTINPPGDELAGAEFLAGVFAEAGVASQVLPYGEGRANFIARLPSSGAEPPICLLSHLDVAAAEPEHWPEGKGPLSGTIDEEGLIWGRGALDMKGMGIMEVQAMLALARLEVPLKRDVILLAVADEEVDNTGAKRLVAENWEELGCAYVLNEGGVGFKDLFFEGQDVFPISVGEKGVLWLRMVASGEPGHGSTPVPGRSPEILLAAAQKIFDRTTAPTYDPSLVELLDNVGAHAGGLPGMVLKSPGLTRLLLRGRLMGDPLTRAVLTNTIHLTGYGGAMQPNVVPGESWANLDIRMLPGTNAEDMLAELEALVDDERVRFEVISNEPAAVSEWHDDPVYDALVARVIEDRPGAVAGPALSPGFTDSIYLRPLGVRAYGFVPFLITPEQAVTMHGNGEHVSTENLTDGVRILYRVLVDVAADPEGTWVAPEAPAPPPRAAPTPAEDIDASEVVAP